MRANRRGGTERRSSESSVTWSEAWEKSNSESPWDTLSGNESTTLKKVSDLLVYMVRRWEAIVGNNLGWDGGEYGGRRRNINKNSSKEIVELLILHRYFRRRFRSGTTISDEQVTVPYGIPS
ncbi:hypothetical protein Tcan_02710 [Toxocara canis]|uniref:Uncharacterized protein n=1 Tax=Toxocara canis TaxID=6265 RepID=A0A0B2V8B8_TOXCA|nr:hypothetical protein Tcan_02710 [Toxocara canis]